MKRLIVILLVVLAAVPALVAQTVTPDQIAALKTTTVLLWTKEGEADQALQYVQYLADTFSRTYPRISFEVVNKNVEVLREDFQTASLAGTPPDLLWTVSDHAGPFTTAKLIQPVDALFPLINYVTSAVNAVKLGGKTWGVPISNGNHLMLMYNKKLIATARHDERAVRPARQAARGRVPPGVQPDRAVLAGAVARRVQGRGLRRRRQDPHAQHPGDDQHPGAAEADEGQGPGSPESDYNGAETLFKEGKAAMLINGDWSLVGYRDAMGEDFGVARIPMVSATSTWPAPYTSGAFFMIPTDTTGAKLTAVRGFVQFATSRSMQVEMIKRLSRLPALKTALTDEDLTSNVLLKNSADQMVVGTPMPTVLEMRAVWDAMKPEMAAVLAGSKTPQAAAAAMQSAALAGIKKLQ